MVGDKIIFAIFYPYYLVFKVPCYSLKVDLLNELTYLKFDATTVEPIYLQKQPQKIPYLYLYKILPVGLTIPTNIYHTYLVFLNNIQLNVLLLPTYIRLNPKDIIKAEIS